VTKPAINALGLRTLRVGGTFTHAKGELSEPRFGPVGPLTVEVMSIDQIKHNNVFILPVERPTDSAAANNIGERPPERKRKS